MKYIRKYMEKSLPPGNANALILIQGITWRWFPKTVVGITHGPVKEYITRGCRGNSANYVENRADEIYLKF